jgi:manganese/iron transport system permease protein
MLLTAAAVAVSASLLGVYLSFFLDSAPAPTIVLLLTAAFLAAFAVSGRATRAEMRARTASDAGQVQQGTAA